MTSSASSVDSRLLRWAYVPTTFFVSIVAFVAERLMSRRGLILFFFLACAWLATAGWIRPPLSADIHGLNLPLGIWSGGLPADEFIKARLGENARDGAMEVKRVSPEEILKGTHRVLIDSVGVFLLAVIVVCGVVALWRPRLFGHTAGLLLSAALCANAAAWLNHSLLVYLMDLELEQRAQISHFYWAADNDSATNSFNDRITGQPSNSSVSGLLTARAVPSSSPTVASIFSYLPAFEEERGGWERGLLYMKWGPYLALLASVGMLFGLGGHLSHRMRLAAVYTLFGVGLAGLTCSQRIRAEYYWQGAKSLESRCDFEGARTALESCCSVSEEFKQREQTWLLVGKMDDAETKSTSSRLFYRAFQAYRPKPRPEPVARLEDLPAWPPITTNDSREWRWAAGTSDQLLSGEEIPLQPAAHQASRFWTQIGLIYHLQEPQITESGFHYGRREIVLTAALEAWRRASQLSPTNEASHVFEGLALARIDREQPERVRQKFQAVLDNMSDRPMRADILASLGDCYMEAGQFRESLPYYMQSADAYTLPKVVNHRALRGLGGW